MRTITKYARRRLPLVHFVSDAVVWAAALPIAVWFRYDFDFGQVGSGVARAILLAAILQGLAGLAFGLYRRRWRYGSFDEVRVVALTAFTTGTALTVLLWRDTSLPRSVPPLATGAALLAQIAVRSVWRLYKARSLRPRHDDVRRLVVVGAGFGGEQILRTLVTTPNSAFLLVALLDDDPYKRNLRFSGIRVEGTSDQLPEIAKRHDADAILIAIPSANRDVIRRLTAVAEANDLTPIVLPSVHELLGPIGVADIRQVTEIDLLGRHPADIDPVSIAGYVTGCRVLVTGAGGSIGSELCRQLSRFEPAQLLLLDRDESGLHGTQLSIRGRAMLDDPSLILADIRDTARIREIFALYRPEVVFHAAAPKHLPLLEMYPTEGWKTNVGGTLNLLESASEFGVKRFVNVSTDKAANPTSVLGWTKPITERLTAYHGFLNGMEAVSVRFGNVLGSNGSVLKAVEAQSALGGPITVTHPDVTRYFMTIEEAARLTVQAGAIGNTGEVLVLDMGEPVKIVDVAARYANQHAPPLKIEFTGLRPNEKMHEDLVAAEEHGERRVHKLITHVGVPPLKPTGDMRCAEPLVLDLDRIALARRRIRPQSNPPDCSPSRTGNRRSSSK